MYLYFCRAYQCEKTNTGFRAAELPLTASITLAVEEENNSPRLRDRETLLDRNLSFPGP